MKCYDCDFENPEKSKFCGKCGKALGREQTSEKQKEKGQSSYKKLLPVVGVLVILLLGYWVIAPKTTDVPETLVPTATPVPEYIAPIDTKTGVASSPIPTSQSLASTTSATPTKATPATRTIILEPIDKQSAGIRSDGDIQRDWWVGDNSRNEHWQTFLSYSVAGIPTNVTITEATIDFSQYRRGGDPFSYLGCLGAYEQFFGAPDAKDFFLGTPTEAVAKWCSDGELSSPLKSKNLASALQNILGKNMFQIRSQFDTGTDNNNQDDSIIVAPGKIIVTYTVP